jgi:hypothetical protein
VPEKLATEKLVKFWARRPAFLPDRPIGWLRARHLAIGNSMRAIGELFRAATVIKRDDCNRLK